MEENYTKLLDRITRSSSIEKEEIERKIEAKRAKLSGLISKEGAAQIVAAELGINFDQEKLKISEIIQDMKRVNVIGKIVRMNAVREYNKNGREGKIGSFLLADETSNIRTVLWDTNHIELIEKGEIKEGSVVEISNGGVRNGDKKLYWTRRLFERGSERKYDDVIFRNGYGKDRPWMRVEFLGVRVDERRYAILLGDILESGNI